MTKSKKAINKNVYVKKERLFSISITLTDIKNISLFSFILFAIWYILHNKWIEIYIHKESNKYESMLFSVIVSMTFLMFQLACGFDFRFTNKYIKLIIITIVLVIVYYGFNNYGLGFIINKDFGQLYYHTYESNSRKGLLFFIRNFLFWSYVYLASLLFMTRD